MHVNVAAVIEQSASFSVPVVPAGIGSDTTTPAGTLEGPAFVTVMVKVVDDPGVTLATPSVFVIPRSAETLTESTSVAASLAPFGSGTGTVVIVAVFASVTGAYPGGTATASW